MPETTTASYDPVFDPYVTGLIGQDSPLLWGNVRLADLQQNRVVLEDGPTGYNTYWPADFSYVHPDLITSDSGFNLVDEVWIGRRPRKVYIEFVIAEPHVPDLRSVLEDLRRMVPLPVDDLAAMVGIKRRQFYNLLAGRRGAPSEREQWIRQLHDEVERLARAAGDDQRLRAAVLTPIDGSTFYDLACAGDAAAVAAVRAELEGRLAAGAITGSLRRPSPRLARRGRGSETAVQFLSDGEGPGGE